MVNVHFWTLSAEKQDMSRGILRYRILILILGLCVVGCKALQDLAGSSTRTDPVVEPTPTPTPEPSPDPTATPTPTPTPDPCAGLHMDAITPTTAVSNVHDLGLSWAAVTAASSYSVYSGTTSTLTSSTGTLAGNTASVSFTVSKGLAQNKYYRIYADTTCQPTVAVPSCTRAAEAYSGSTTLTVTKSGNDVQLSWTAVGGADHYHVYRGTGASFMCASPAIHGEAPGTTYTDTGAAADTNNYFYKVYAADAAHGDSALAASNMGFKVRLSLVSGYTNFTSLPYGNSFTNADSVFDDITGANLISRHDLSSGSVQMWGGSRGTNFTLTAGESITIGVFPSNFTWTVVGSHNPSLAISLTTISAWGNNENYIAIPYNTKAATASDLFSTITNVTHVERWDNSLGQWQTYQGNSGDPDFNLTLGEGLLIKVNANTSWTPASY